MNWDLPIMFILSSSSCSLLRVPKIWDAKFGQPIGLEISKFSIYHWQYRGVGDISTAKRFCRSPASARFQSLWDHHHPTGSGKNHTQVWIQMANHILLGQEHLICVEFTTVAELWTSHLGESLKLRPRFRC